MTGSSGRATISSRHPLRKGSARGRHGSFSADAASGKTRAGAEWVRGLALGQPPFADSPVERIALIGETLGDARAVMVDGPSGLLAIHRPAERPGLQRLAPRTHLAERRGGAALLGGRSGIPARPAIRRRLGRRAGEMALRRGRLGHAAILPAPRRPSAPGGDDHAASDPAAEAPHRRSRDRDQPGADRRKRRQPRAVLPQRGGRPLSAARGSAGRSWTAS